MDMYNSNPSFGKFCFTLNSRGEQYTQQLKWEIGGLLIIAPTIGEIITIKTNSCTTEHYTLVTVVVTLWLVKTTEVKNDCTLLEMNEDQQREITKDLKAPIVLHEIISINRMSTKLLLLFI